MKKAESFADTVTASGAGGVQEPDYEKEITPATVTKEPAEFPWLEKKAEAPTHSVSVEVKFVVEVDVIAGSEDEAMNAAEKQVQAKYDGELKSSMAGSPRRVDVEAEWANEYVD